LVTPAPEATVVIVTKDRCDDALRAVGSAVAQRPAVEVLVIDDGSSDGTAEAVGEAFPDVLVQRHERSEGLVVRRNEAAELASAPIIVSIDDDAVFTSEQVVATTTAEFDHPRVGAVAMPYVDLPQGEHVLQRAPAETGVFVTHRFRGTAHALRRDAFLSLGGYRGMLFQQAEEPDLAIRLLDAGYLVRLGRADPVCHFASPKRDVERQWFYECRNEVLFAWHNVPMPDLPVQLAKSTLHMLWLGRGVRRTGLFARGLLAGFRAAPRHRSGRRPVGRDAWRLYTRLGKQARRIEEVVTLLDRPQIDSNAGATA
jgi:glycosyltransferase involved in cell wall biosynthesis